MSAAQSTTAPPVIDELVPVALALLEEGFNLSYSSSPNRLRETWLIIERGGNCATLQYSSFEGYTVSFVVKPNKEYGSALLVTDSDSGAIQSIPELVNEAYTGTQSHYRNFATNGKKIPNHGMEHFSWMREAPIALTLEDLLR